MKLTTGIEKFNLPDKRADEAIELIQRARAKGHTDGLAVRAVISYLVREEHGVDWDTIAEKMGDNKNQLISKKRSLTRDGILDQEIPYPSNKATGEAAALLEVAEKSHPDVIFDGTSPTTWVEGATTADRWIRLVESHVDDDAADRLLALDSTSRYIADTTVIGEGRLGALLAQRRHTIGSLRIATGETTKRVRERLGSLREYNDEYALNEIEHAGRVWYWTTSLQR